ncbi:MAG: hypothetical protein AB1758_18345 [Candidatus Eremiobacterota bacterium]
MADTLRGICLTTTGMCGLWDSTHFPMIYDAESWAEQMGSEPDLLRHVRGGYFVPVNLRCPGAFYYEVRVGRTAGMEHPGPREAAWIAASSHDYLFRSSGWLCFGDYRHVEVVPSDRVGVLAVDPGEYVASVHILAWDEEQGSQDEEGNRSEAALPDLLILLNPAPPTFNPPGTLQTFP